jgi:REP element-mobilizing transposase RayT
MSRPLRLEFPGAIYRMTSCCNRREPIYRDDVDRQMQLDVLGLAMDYFDAEVLAWCQMGNHWAHWGRSLILIIDNEYGLKAHHS